MKSNPKDREEILDSMLSHAQLMAKSSLCPLGQSPVLPLQSMLTHFSDMLKNE
jgi:NADH:ubiquinone oxidoreductase subunit F (NADH-binding)